MAECYVQHRPTLGGATAMGRQLAEEGYVHIPDALGPQEGHGQSTAISSRPCLYDIFCVHTS